MGNDTHEPVPEAPVPHHNLTTTRYVAVSVVIVLTQLVQMIPYGAGVNASLKIGDEFGVDQVESAWFAASYPLTQGAFVLIGGRIGAIYGHKNTLLVAGVWWTIFSLVSGFARSLIALCIFRGLTGVGGAFIMPNAIALLLISFPPGRIKNLSVGFFAAMGPIGAAGGSIFAGFFGQLTPWKWLFFFLAMLGAVLFASVWFVVPGESEPLDKDGSIDIVGAYLGVGGLILFNFVWNQAPAVGWDTPYEYILLIVASLHLGAFIFWEGKIAKQPILPLDIWTAPSFGALTVVAFFSFMSFGVVIWYVNAWNQIIRGYSIFLASAAIVPLTILGAVGAIISAWLIPRLDAQYIIAIGDICILVALVLIATMPAQQTYWAQMFPATIFMAFCPDFIFSASQIISSNSVRKHEQGIAGSLMGTLLCYGLSTGLGFAGTVEAYTNNHGQDLVEGYRHALYLGMGMAGTALILNLLFVRTPKDTREGWDEDGLPASTRSSSRGCTDKEAP